MLLTTTLALVAAVQDPGIVWRTDLEDARSLAREQGRPLLAVFRCEP